MPNDSAMDRLSGRAVPNNCGLALICNADSGDICGRYAAITHDFAACCDGGCPEVLWFMFDPTGMGKMLRKFLLRDSLNAALTIEQYRPA